MTNRVFISYSRKDGKDFAADLRTTLLQQGLAVWQDVFAMEGGRDWWAQIDEALDNVEFMVLVATPAAMQSEIVSREWHTARQKGVCVYPVVMPGHAPDFATLPRWMRDVHFYDYAMPAQREKFLRDLQQPCTAPRVKFMVSTLPDNFVPREQELAAIIEQFVDAQGNARLVKNPQGKPTAMIAGLRGAGGYGKTTLARAVCHDLRMQNAFHSGILWVELGETPQEAVSYLNELIYILTDERPVFVTVDAARTRLQEILQHQMVLLVVDDVWKREHLTPFLDLGESVALLLTTRNSDTLPSATEKIPVGAMQPSEAIQLLLAGIQPSPLPPLPQGEGHKIKELAARLGEWALLLKLVNGVLLNRIQAGQSLVEAISYVEKVLDKRGLLGFDARDSAERSHAVTKTIGISLDLLTEQERRRYSELAIFPEDVDVPFATLQKLWDMDDLDVEDFAWLLFQRSLLLDCNLQKRTIRLHDMIREYLNGQVRSEIAVIHERFLAAYQVEKWTDLPDDETYLWDHLVHHLMGAEDDRELDTTLNDLGYLSTKIFLRGVPAVERDFSMRFKPLYESSHLKLENNLHTGIIRNAHILSRCATRHDVYLTLAVRLNQDIDPRTTPYIVPMTALPDLPHPALTRTLMGHTDRVNTCAIDPASRWIVSGGGDADCKLKIWSLETGEELLNLVGHTSWINGCAISPDGTWIVSASNDHTLKIWDRESGEAIQTLVGHSDAVIDCTVSPDGRWVVSSSSDCSLIIWEVATGQARHRLTGHTAWVGQCGISPDGTWLVSASADNLLKIWDVKTGTEIRTLAGHPSWVTACAISPDGQVIYAFSADGTLIVWDSQTGLPLETRPKFTKWVFNCTVDPQGRWLVAGLTDGTLPQWRLPSFEPMRTLTGHTDSLTDCVVNKNGRLLVSSARDKSVRIWSIDQLAARANTPEFTSVDQSHRDDVTACLIPRQRYRGFSASQDKSIKLWEQNAVFTLSQHGGGVNALAATPDETWLISGGADGKVVVWDLATHTPTLTINAHRQPVTGCAISPDGKWIVSASRDKKLKIWDRATGEGLLTLKGHTEAVTGCAISPNGRWLVSSSEDGTLRLWNSRTGHHSDTLRGHRGAVLACAITPDGKAILSTSADHTLKLWSADTGAEQCTFVGHTAAIRACAISPDQRYVLSASLDKTLKVWDIQTAACLATFYADSLLFSCAWHPDSTHLIAGGEAGYLYWLKFVAGE